MKIVPAVAALLTLGLLGPAVLATAGTPVRGDLARALTTRDPDALSGLERADARDLRPREFVILARLAPVSSVARAILDRFQEDHGIPELRPIGTAGKRPRPGIWVEEAARLLEGRPSTGSPEWMESDAEVARLPLRDILRARRAVDRALEIDPDLPAARALRLRIEAARRLVEDALVGSAAGSLGASGSAGAAEVDETTLSLAFTQARRADEPEILAWLLGLSPTPSDVALSLVHDDDLVREAALRARLRLAETAAQRRRVLSDRALDALLAARHHADVRVVEGARQMLEGPWIERSRRERVAEALAEPATRPPAEREPTRVTVFYGTDRAELRPTFAGDAARFRTPTLVLAAALLLPFALRWLLHPRFESAIRWGRRLGVVAGFVLVALAIRETVGAKRQHERLGIRYGGERGPFDAPDGPYAHLGTCVVGIPPGHEQGQVERPGILSGELWEDPEKHVVLLSIRPLERDAFLSALTDRGSESAFVYVHGFNVTFEDAALRTAQIAHDLDFTGAPIFFSWPSRGETFSYTIDESTVAWATRHLKAFLVDVRRALPTSTIHLVAHSMGNRALTEALRRLADDIERENLPRFQEVVLAAPDIDAATFRDDIAPAIRMTSDRVTLYASAKDQALVASKQVHGYPRAGDAGSGLLVVPGVQSIDVAHPDPDILGHSYYGSVGRVLDDLVALLLFRRHPEHRGLERVEQDGRAFWRLR